MTTAPPTTRERTVRGAPARRGVTAARVLRAESTKLTSVPAHVWLALGIAVLTTVACVVGILPAAASRDLPVDLTAGDAPALLLGMVLFLVGLALLGHALGALLRRTVPALVTALVLVMILPIVLMLASDPLVAGGDPASLAAPEQAAAPTVVGTLNVLLPGTAGGLLTTSASSGPMDGSPDLGPVGGGLVLAAWIAVLLVAAAVRLRTRDVR